MANRAKRLARAKKREKIRLGPSETAQAYLNLLGIKIEFWPPPPMSFGRQPGVLVEVTGEALIKARANLKYWYATVEDTPHISKQLFCTCEEQWIAEAKSLRQRADKFKKEYPGQMVFPHGVRTGRISAKQLAQSYGKSVTNWPSKETLKKMWLGVDLAKTEARVTAHMQVPTELLKE